MAILALLAAALLAAPPSAPLHASRALNRVDASSSAAGVDAELGAAELAAALPEPPSLTELILAQAQAQAAPETLQGFDTVVLTQINALFGSERLPLANGGPIEPGIYVTISPQQALIFDTKMLDLEAGRVPPGPASRECKSGCKASLWAPFRQIWLQALEEAATYNLGLPARVLFAAEASVPAQTLVELAYAAAETRPGAPPGFTLLVNGSNAGLRARPFYLLPPGGLRVAPGDNVLGLRVSLGAGEAFTISAAHPRFAPNIEGVGWQELAAQLAGVKKRHPNKETIIIDVDEGATVGDVVTTMVAAQKHFPNVVLTDDVPVRWG